MIEKPNKDGKPPTVEYQEEEMLVSTEKYLCMSSLYISEYCQLYLASLLPFVGYCLWCSGKAVLQHV